MNTTTNTTNTVATIKGGVFIIPNGVFHSINVYGKTLSEKLKEWAKFILRMHRDIYVPVDNRYIEVWCFSYQPDMENNISNWGCHYEMHLPGHEDEPGECFPRYLPVSLFEGKKEGETVEFDSKWGHIVLKLDQMSGRYRQHGKFHECLSYLLKRDCK